MGEEITVTGTVEAAENGSVVVRSEAEQSGQRIIRNAVAELAP